MAGRACSVCTHPDAVEINEALVIAGASNRGVASRYGLSQAAVDRHKKHIPQLLVKASQALEIVTADDLLDKVRDLTRRTEGLLDRAEDEGDLNTAFRGVAQLRSNLELLGRLLGELQEGTTINIIQNPQWLQLRAVIVGALEPHPEAKSAVVKALEGASDG
jgi:hypothetical protein